MPDGSRLNQPVTSALVTVPNIITFARLCGVPLAVWLVLESAYAEAFVVFAAAGISDGIDGWIARQQNSRSVVGAVLDPLADKALLVSMFVVLAAMHVLPSWLTILVVFRDLLIVGGVILMAVLGMPLQIAPLFVSKVNTTAQILLVAAVLLGQGFGLSVPWLVEVLSAIVAVTTLASGVAYMRLVLVSR